MSAPAWPRASAALLLVLALLALVACRPDASEHSHRRHASRPPAELPSALATAGTAIGADPTGSVHCTLGCPVWAGATPTDDYVIARAGYVIAYSPSHQVPSWAAWRLTPADYGGQARHTGHFLTDESLPAGWTRVAHEDYTGSGFDRGHLVDSADRTSSAAANDATFLMTNVAPQRHDMNGGPWLRLEEECRRRAKHDGRTVYVIAGPVWASPGAPATKTIGRGVGVPVAFWKVAVVLGPDARPGDVAAETPVLAAVMPNAEGIAHDGWARYRASLAAVEQRSGYRALGRVRAEVLAALREQEP